MPSDQLLKAHRPEVILMARGYMPENLGGGVKDLQVLLKAYGQREIESFALTAVFADKVAYSYRDLTPILDRGGQPSPKPDLAARLVPTSLRAAAGLVLSTARFTLRLRQATRGKGDRKLIFHAFDFLAAYLCARRFGNRYPLILTVPFKGGWVREGLLQYPVYRGTPVERLLRHIENTAVHRADIITFSSRGSQALFEDAHPGLLQGKDVRITYNGPDLEELDSVPEDNGLLARYGVERETAALYVGPLIADKGADTLIEALALLPEGLRSRLACLAVGRGHLRDELQSLIGERGLQDRVRLLGFLPRQEFLQLMKAATLFVLPSRVAVFDYALLEAGAMGLPIITSAVGGNLEMFDEDSALLVPPDDPPALAAAIARLLSDEALRQRLGQNARQRIRSQFSLESMFNAYAAIYQELASRPGP